MFRNGVILILYLGCSLMSYANSIADDFQKSKSYAKSLGSQPLNAMNQFHPETTFKEYNSAPVEKRYYQGVEKEKTDLTNEATQALKNDAGGQIIVAHFGEHQYDINQNSQVIKSAKLIEEESYALTHGLSNDKVNCEEPPKACETKSHDEICHISRVLPDTACTKKRNVTVSTEHINQRADFEIWVVRPGNIKVNLITGVMSGVERGSLSNPLKLSQPCDKMAATVHSITTNGQKASWVSTVSLPTCQNNGEITLFVPYVFNRFYPLKIALTVDVQSKAYISEEYWDNGCQAIEANGLCHLKEERCTDSNPTRVIDGIPVSRDCWQQEATYSCSSAAADECRVPREKGCLQTRSRCVQKAGDACTLYEQVYSCQEQACPVTPSCVKNLFCADGNCTEQVATQNENFGTSMAPLAVAGEAAREFSKTQAALFSGRPVQCKIWIGHLVDCCSNKGWADKIHLDLCKEEDKELGKAKLNYLAHYVGKYCSKKELGVCVEHRRTYCVFDSKMARIIQEEGRLKQQNPNALGDAEHTTCAGLSVNELQQLDMGRIDFVSPIYPYPSGSATKEAGIVGDVRLNTPNSAASTDEMKRRIEKRAAK